MWPKGSQIVSPFTAVKIFIVASTFSSKLEMLSRKLRRPTSKMLTTAAPRPSSRTQGHLRSAKRCGSCVRVPMASALRKKRLDLLWDAQHLLAMVVWVVRVEIASVAFELNEEVCALHVGLEVFHGLCALLTQQVGKSIQGARERAMIVRGRAVLINEELEEAPYLRKCARLKLELLGETIRTASGADRIRRVSISASTDL